jgi:hypothetical protein
MSLPSYHIGREGMDSLTGLMEKVASNQRREAKIRSEVRARESALLRAYNAKKKGGSK